jgi:D-alanine-D-alanine ligase-like ATP-grasp enzyme/ribosomal protein S18 acetylase RimI-like enzyme
MAAGSRGFIPVLHAATLSRPDEIDSIVTAEAVTAALQSLGYAAEIVALAPGLAALETLPARRPLVVFNLVDAVDGDCRLAPMVPARLDALGLPYTGAGTSAWLETLSKVATKLKLRAAGLPTPDWSEDGSGLDPDLRVIVKPIWEHGSLGIDAASVVRTSDAPRLIAERTGAWRTEHFAEGFIKGREFAASLIEGPEGVEVLPLRETVFQGFAADAPQITGYDAKWTPESAAWSGTPRRFGIESDEPALAAELQRLALACWRLFGVRGYARVDFRVDASGAPFILEVNMNPCLGRDAGFAASAAHAGLSYEGLVARIVGIANPASRHTNGHAPAEPAPGALAWRSTVAAEDVARVRALVAATGMFNPAEIEVAASLVTERLAKGAASDCHFIFAERGRELVGFACYGPIAGTQDSFDLYWIAVAPTEQGRGLGADLCARAEAAMGAAGAKHIYVETSCSDRYAPTRGFYQRLGFAEQARLPDFYAPGDGKVIYVKTLSVATHDVETLGSGRLKKRQA